MICGVSLTITFKLADIERNLGRHNSLIGVMEKRVIDELVEIKEAQTIHKKRKKEME